MGHGSVTSTRTRLGAAALGLGGVVFGLIQVLERSVSAFDPRPEVSLMIAVTIGLAALTLERLRHRTREVKLLAGLLRVWPLRRVADTEPLALGVFPPRTPPLGPYVARDADVEVDDALRRGGLVLVIGPNRAGKSRTVHEAAVRILPDRPAIVPLGGPALSDLIADAAFTPPANAVWWLDDLERFLPHLNGPELSALLDGRTVVATIREDAWRALLRAGGESGERGRRLLAAAQAIHLPAEPAAAEPEAPDLRATPQPPSRSSDAAVIGRERDPALFAGAAATAVAGAALVLILSAGGFSTDDPPPIGAQVDAIRQDAARAGRPTVLALSGNFHGVDQRSHLFVMRPEAGGSDELRVYDEEGGRLRRRLVFQPLTKGGGGSAAFVGVRDQQERGLMDYALVEPLVTDMDGDGDREIIASYFLRSSLARLRLPIVVAWDEQSRRYELSPLLEEAPPAPDERAQVIEYFDGSYKLDDRRNRRRIRVGGVSSFALVRGTGREPGLLVTATEAVDRARRPVLLAVSLYRISFERGRPRSALQCTLPIGPSLIRAPLALGADYRALLTRRAPGLARAIVGEASPDGRACKSSPVTAP